MQQSWLYNVLVIGDCFPWRNRTDLSHGCENGDFTAYVLYGCPLAAKSPFSNFSKHRATNFVADLKSFQSHHWLKKWHEIQNSLLILDQNLEKLRHVPSLFRFFISYFSFSCSFFETEYLDLWIMEPVWATQ